MVEEKTKAFKKYQKILRMQISKKRWVVISKTMDDRISIAQQIEGEDYEGNPEYFFLKNAFIFESIEIFDEFRKQLANVKIEE